MDQPRTQRSCAVRRTGALVLALLQLASAGLVPFADVAVHTGSFERARVVEAADNEQRGSHHDHVTCQFCRMMSLSGTTASLVSFAQMAAAASVVAGIPPSDAPPPSAGLPGGPGSRAPPLA